MVLRCALRALEPRKHEAFREYVDHVTLKIIHYTVSRGWVS